MSKTIKLRMISQCTFFTDSNKFVFFNFNPASMYQPLLGQRAATATPGPYVPHPSGATTYGKWVDKQQLTGLGDRTKQPTGYDTWLYNSAAADPDGNRYQRYVVLGSKITVTTLDGHTDDQASAKFYGGFTKLQNQSSDYGNTLGNKYGHINDGEVADWLDTGMCPKIQVIQSNPFQMGLQTSRTFVFNYSMKKYRKRLKRSGVDPLLGAWFGTHGAAPEINPFAYLVIADLGGTTAATAIPSIVVFDYTVRLSGNVVADRSSV